VRSGVVLVAAALASEPMARAAPTRPQAGAASESGRAVDVDRL
jgi:hypothetical protein